MSTRRIFGRESSMIILRTRRKIEIFALHFVHYHTLGHSYWELNLFKSEANSIEILVIDCINIS